jgi:hypothetical protein
VCFSDDEMDAAPISETTEANNVEAAVAEVSEVKVEVFARDEQC